MKCEKDRYCDFFYLIKIGLGVMKCPEQFTFYEECEELFALIVLRKWELFSIGVYKNVLIFSLKNK